MRHNVILFRGNNLASMHPNNQIIGSGFRKKHSRHYHHGGAIALPTFLSKLSLAPANDHRTSSISDFITHRGGSLLKARPKGKKPIKFLM